MFVGDAVAPVVADDEEIAEKARDLIRVDYEVLPPAMSPEEGLRKGAPQLHPNGNVCTHLTHTVGDVEQGLAQADLVSGHFETPIQEHAYLEPEAGVKYWEDEILILKVPTQSPFELLPQMARTLNLPDEKTRIIVTPIGGGFGSKFDATVEPLLAWPPTAPAAP